MSTAHLLALQRAAGNGAVAASLQRAAAAAPQKAGVQADDRNDTIDLLNGFEELATAAANNGGRNLDAVHFGKDLSAAHGAVLEQIRKVLILAQEPSPASKRAAVAEWPGLAAKLHGAIDHGRQLHIPEQTLAALANNVAAIGEKYVKVPHKGPSQVEDSDDYLDLMAGTQQLLAVVQEEVVDKTSTVVPTNIQEINSRQRHALGAVQFGGHLTDHHRQVLDKLRTALILARTEAPGSARSAQTLWRSIEGDFRLVFKRAPTYVAMNFAALQQDLNRIGQELIVGGVYSEDHNRALSQINLKTPDLAFQELRLQEAAEGFEELHKLVDKAKDLAYEDAIDNVLSTGTIKYSGGNLDGKVAHAIFELVKNPGEIREKLEEFKKKDLIGKSVTVAEMADKILALRNAVYKVTFEIVKRYAEKQIALAAAKAGAEELKAHWEKIAKWAENKAELLEKVEKVAAVITVVISAIKIIDLIRDGKLAEAAREAASTILSLAAGAAGGAAGSAMFGGIAIVVAAEIEGIEGAAAMIHYSRKTNMKEAAQSFVGICSTAAMVEATDLVADVKLLSDGATGAEKALIEKNLASCTPHWLRHLEALSNQINDTRASQLGGQPKLRAALGGDALQILENPGTWAGSWQSMAEQIRVVFAGANAMATVAVDEVTKMDKPAKPEKKETHGEE